MGLLKIDKSKLVEEKVKTTPENVQEANDASSLLRRIYDSCYSCLSPSTIPAAVLVIAKYQYQCAFVADQEINLLAALTEIMVECEFK